MDAFGVAFGNVVPGSGFAAGLQYTRTDLWGERLRAIVTARDTANRSYLGRLDLSLPDHFRGWVFVDFKTTYRNISEMPNYGAGPESVKDSNYRLEDTTVEFRPAVSLNACSTICLSTDRFGAVISIAGQPGRAATLGGFLASQAFES